MGISPRLIRPAQSAANLTSVLLGERRQVTALFYDIVSSTQLMSQMDPEDFSLVQHRIHALAATIINRFGGCFGTTHGDGGCAFFGVPEPAEDAAECAVTAGLELIGCVEAHSTETAPGERVELRVGVATGLIILSTSSKRQIEPGSDIVGFAPNLAARVQAVASPSTVVVSESTFELTHSLFEFEFLGAHGLKGFNEPQKLWRAIRRVGTQERFAFRKRSSVRFISREEETKALHKYWSDACSGHGHVVLVTGEAGIGKSRLISEFINGLEDEHSSRIFQCQARANKAAFHPFLTELERERANIASHIQTISPELQNVIGFLTSEGKEKHSVFQGLAPHDIRHRLIGGMCELVAQWASAAPQLIVIEDLHWADSLTRAFASELVSYVSSIPALILITARSTKVLEKSARSPSQMRLPPLYSEDLSELIQEVWHPDTPPADIAKFILDRSDGIPLYAEELSRFVKHRLDKNDEAAKRNEAFYHSGEVVSLQELLEARLAQVGTSPRRVAQFASVLGRDFTPVLLCALAHNEFSPDQINKYLAKLIEAKVIEVVAQEANTLRFRHTLLQEVAYGSLLKSDRRELHRRVVAEAKSQNELILSSDLMAWHCEGAGLFTDAVSYAIDAAESASVRSAFIEAEQLSRQAESLLEKSDADPAVRLSLILRLLTIQGPVAIALHGTGSSQSRSIYERGVALCQEHSELERELWFPLYWGWWFTSPDFSVQRERSMRIVDDLETARDPEVRLQAFHCAWATDFNTGNHRDCLCKIQRGLALYDATRAARARVQYGGHDARVCALGERGLAEWFLGNVDDAINSIRESLEWAEEIGHIGSVCHALDIAVMLHACRRDLPKVMELSDRMREIAHQHSLPSLKAKSQIFGGWARGLIGSTSEGLGELEDGLDLQARIGTEEDFPVYREMQAEILLLSGRLNDALTIVSDTIERASEAGHLFWIPELFRRRALLLKAQDANEETILNDLLQGQRIAETQGSMMLSERIMAEVSRIGVKANSRASS